MQGLLQKDSFSILGFSDWEVIGSLKFLAIAFFESMNLSFCRKQQNGITDYGSIC